MSVTPHKILQSLPTLEGILLSAALAAFWFPSNYPGHIPAEPIDRAQFTWVLLLIVVVKIVQWLAVDFPEEYPSAQNTVYGKTRRKFLRWFSEINTPLLPWLIGFIIMAAVNTWVAPYPTRGLFMLIRPVMGLAWVIYLTEESVRNKSIQKPILSLLVFSIFVGLIALGTTEWTGKSKVVMGIIELIPRLNLQPFITSFNSNEIGGVLAWLVPFSAGLILFPAGEGSRLYKILSITAFVVTCSALFLGQSRFAIAGVLMGLYIIAFLMIPRGRIPYLVIFTLMVVTILQATLISSRIDYSPNVQRGDEKSFMNRFSIWGSALHIIKDYPLTGVGINNFRVQSVRQRYPAAGFDYDVFPEASQSRILPHAHNEILQAGSDMGILGMVIFVGWHFAAARMLWLCWRNGGQGERVITISLAMGIGAHAIFGMGDAIPVWDRTNFIHWLLLGLVSAQYKIKPISFTH